MTLGPEMILTPQVTTVSVDLEPVAGMMASLGVLHNDDSNPGSAPWIRETFGKMTPEQRQRHIVVFGQLSFEGILNAVPRGPAYVDFERFLRALRRQEPTYLRDQIFYNMVHSMRFYLNADSPKVDYPDIAHLLADADFFNDYIHERYRGTGDEKLEIDPNLHRLLNDPPALKEIVNSHLEDLWREFGQSEWERVRPALEKSVAVLQKIDTAGMTPFQAIYAVTGRDLSSILDAEQLQYIPEIRLIPSLHTGPYTLWFGDANMIYIVFGARSPQGVASGVTALDDAELINRLKALADDTRLDILRALRQHGEMSTQAIIDLFDLDKSAASRHLRMLRANEFIAERRDNKTKFYALNRRHMQSMLRALRVLLDD